MNQQNSQSERERRYDPELLKKGLKCDLDQLEMLKRCSDKKDITEWNQWRKEHVKEEILLEGAKLNDSFLKNANFESCHFNKARFTRADLKGCDFRHTEIKEAILTLADIRDADFSYAELQGAKFPFVIVNEKTRFFKGAFDKHTWFWGVALKSMRIADEMRLLLEYNVRRIKWENWFRYRDWYEAYPEKERSKIDRIIRQPINWFLYISDYGRSTGRIIGWFFGLAFVFALLYRLFPDFVKVYDTVGDIRGFWHALYFSVVTMTTLGFGDIAANPDSWLG